MKLNNIVKGHKGILSGVGIGVVGSGLIGNLGLAAIGTTVGVPSACVLVPLGLLVGSMADK